MNNNHIEYRKEVLAPFFEYIRSGESLFVIGAPSVGKTRLMDFLMGDDPDAVRAGITPDRERVKVHYLGSDLAARVWLPRVDMNRLSKENDWGFNFFELLLNAILFTCNDSAPAEQVEKLRDKLAALDSQVIESRDVLMAYRLLEMAVNMLCHSYGIRLCFLFDEFDETYKTMPHEIFAQLRAIRDANKYLVSYALFLRNLPDKLRSPIENESFYELISRNMIEMGPFTRQDTFHMIGQLEARYEMSLTPDQCEWLYTLSGGHPGFVHALIQPLHESHQKSFTEMPTLDWYTRQEFTLEESRKIWNGLLEDEKAGLMDFVRGKRGDMPAAAHKLLLAKGLLVESGVENSERVFSPLFAYWLSKQ